MEEVRRNMMAWAEQYEQIQAMTTPDLLLNACCNAFPLDKQMVHEIMCPLNATECHLFSNWLYGIWQEIYLDPALSDYTAFRSHVGDIVTEAQTITHQRDKELDNVIDAKETKKELRIYGIVASAAALFAVVFIVLYVFITA